MTWGRLLPVGVKNTLILGFILAGGITAALNGQDHAINGADIYNSQALVEGKFQSFYQGDSLALYAQISFSNPVTDSIPLTTLMAYENGTLETANLELQQAIDNQNDQVFTFKWQYPLEEALASFSIEVNIRPRIWTFSEGIAPQAAHPSGGVSIKGANGLPLFDSYQKVGDSLEIRSQIPTDTVFAFYYRHSFDPARSPVSTNGGGSSSELKIDSVLALPVNRLITFFGSGLYFIQADTNSISGTALYVGSKGFPKPRMVEELSEPLVYITTKEEFQAVKSDFSSKKALDKFWLTTVGNPQKARSAIKSYYQFVESANRYFTSYKEGWKTDRGMIFTVMGPPLVVYKNKNREIWGYLQGDTEVEFTFVKVSNIFSNNHFELLRDEELARPWFRGIDRWRKGLTGF